MLYKTYETEVNDLVEKAKEMIKYSPQQDNKVYFIPYADEMLGEIRYIKFVLNGGNWVHATAQ